MEATLTSSDGLRDRSAAIAKALADAKRLCVVERLADGERSVSDLSRDVGCQVPNMSQHLAVLRSAGIVASRREGSTVFYRLADPDVLEDIDSCNRSPAKGRRGKDHPSTHVEHPRSRPTTTSRTWSSTARSRSSSTSGPPGADRVARGARDRQAGREVRGQRRSREARRRCQSAHRHALRDHEHPDGGLLRAGAATARRGRASVRPSSWRPPSAWTH